MFLAVLRLLLFVPCDASFRPRDARDREISDLKLQIEGLLNSTSTCFELLENNTELLINNAKLKNEIRSLKATSALKEKNRKIEQLNSTFACDAEKIKSDLSNVEKIKYCSEDLNVTKMKMSDCRKSLDMCHSKNIESVKKITNQTNSTILCHAEKIKSDLVNVEKVKYCNADLNVTKTKISDCRKSLDVCHSKNIESVRRITNQNLQSGNVKMAAATERRKQAEKLAEISANLQTCENKCADYVYKNNFLIRSLNKTQEYVQTHCN